MNITDKAIEAAAEMIAESEDTASSWRAPEAEVMNE